ncbi:MAG: PstS family phosphate ABC transporter substrate-binding protein [Chloroflexota bacterium]|nr:PstS family phosphate ABC transporter substrate-binding protein [Chloroflexota bacterium]
MGSKMRARMARAGLALALLGTLAFATAPVLAQETDLGSLSGSIEIDGSSTVAPVTEAVAEEFGLAGAANVEIALGVSGTGGGFERFCNGETAISNASRPIAEDEVELCAENGVDYYLFELGQDGVTVVVNPANTFLTCISVESLAAIWEDGSAIETYADVDPEFPADPISLYGPGPDSGTFDFFNEEILGDDRVATTDYTPSEDDNVLVEGIAGDPNALGYFGYAYYAQNESLLTDVALAASADLSDCVEPTADTIRDSSYVLSRPLYVYVNAESLQDEVVQEFIRFYLANAEALVAETGYVALPAEEYTTLTEKLDGAIAGEVEPDSAAAGTDEEATPEA